MMGSWKIAIFQYLQKKYWYPEKCQYSNISRENIGILESGKFQYSFRRKPGNIGILECWKIPQKDLNTAFS